MSERFYLWTCRKCFKPFESMINYADMPILSLSESEERIEKDPTWELCPACATEYTGTIEDALLHTLERDGDEKLLKSLKKGIAKREAASKKQTPPKEVTLKEASLMDQDKFRLVVAIMIGVFLLFLAVMMVQKGNREKEMLKIEKRRNSKIQRKTIG